MYSPTPDSADRQTTAGDRPSSSNNNAGQYYAGSSSLGQETDVMHQYYTDHHHNHHHLAPTMLEAAPSSSSNHHHHHYHPHHLHLAGQHQHQHQHQHQASTSSVHLAGHHLHHYPTGCTTTESSLSSTAFMTKSALQLSALFRSCCSKKCLLIFCLSLIMLIFIFVISLSAYLNFLINSSKTNLSPLSGRLRVLGSASNQETSEASKYDQSLTNRTSKEFLSKQKEYEIILRGALDRTQNLLKTYPNHLVKLEVYAFRPSTSATATASIWSGLWVYYRLFLNKRTLMQDGLLMKRKSPDEHLERQFLPRLTQQSLHSGFEQLLATFNTRSSRSISARQQQQQQTLKSFDDQISQLMPIIESIDLQSIQVSSEFDMLALESLDSTTGPPQSMSDNLRASQPLTTLAPLSTIMIATGRPSLDTATDTIRSSQDKSMESGQASANQDQVNGGKKFTLYGYKENSTRPAVSSSVLTNGQARRGDGQAIDAGTTTTTSSLFLLNHQQRKPTTASSAGVRAANGQQMMATNQPQASTSNLSGDTWMTNSNQKQNSANSDNSLQVVKLKSGQPVRVAGSTSSIVGDPKPLATESSVAKAKVGTNLLDDKSSPSNSSHSDSSHHPGGLVVNSSTSSPSSGQQSSSSQPQAHDPGRQKQQVRSGRPANNDDTGTTNNRGNNNETLLMQMVAPYQKIEFSATDSSSSGRPTVGHNGQLSAGTTGATPRDDHDRTTQSSSSSVMELWNKAVNSHQSNAPSRHRPQQGDESRQGLISVSAAPGANQSSSWQKVSLLSSDISDTIRAELANSAANSAAQQVSSTQRPKVSPHLNQGGSLIVVASNKWPSAISPREQSSSSAILLNIDFKNQPGAQDNKGQAMSGGGNKSEPITSSHSQPATSSRRPPNSTAKPARHKQPANSGSGNKKKKVSTSQQANSGTIAPVATTTPPTTTTNDTPTGATNLQPTRGIRIVDNFLANLETNISNKTLATNQSPGAAAAISTAAGSNKSQEAFNYNADNLAPTLPTSIELTRSTSPVTLLTRTSSSSTVAGGSRQPEVAARQTSSHQHRANNVDSATTVASFSSAHHSGGTTESSIRVQQTDKDRLAQFAGSSTLASPVPTSSQQWRPVANSGASTTTNFTGSQTASRFSQLQRKPTTAPTTISGSTTASASMTHLIVPAGSSSQSHTQRPTPSAPVTASSVNHRHRHQHHLHHHQPQQQQQPDHRHVGGSQSPFAMSILETDHDSGSQLFQAELHPRPPSNGNESVATDLFESYRTSRMRQSAAHLAAQAATSPRDQLLNSSSTLNLNDHSGRIVDDFMITPTADKMAEGSTRGTTLIPPLVLSSLAATGSGSWQQAQTLPGSRIPKADQLSGRPRTRGPFAFETLKEASSLLSSPSSSSLDFSESSESLREQQQQQENRLNLAGRLVERSLVAKADSNANSYLDDSKLLVRKRLLLAGSSSDESSLASPPASSDPLNSAPATTNPIESSAAPKVSSGESDIARPAGERPEAQHHHWSSSSASSNNNYRLDRFGDRTRPAFASSNFSASLSSGRQIPASAVRIIMRKQHNKEESGNGRENDNSTGLFAAWQQVSGSNPAQVLTSSSSSSQSATNPLRCQYYGCKTKVDAKFGCLNYTQICDDFIDCLDESDELDCVSLLKYDDMPANLTTLSSMKRSKGINFSNGAGIIYLNRKGLLAPMCIDYFPDNQQPDEQPTGTTGRSKHQQELIRQINTIGQYACSLQSFSRLVSVKINHHNLVDGLDLIKSSKLYHRLSIVGPKEQDEEEDGESSNGRSRSGSPEHEVEISTSSECPSERTVFVKCGGFECGQDSFSIIQDHNNNDDSAEKTRNGAIISNFPWLVKLYRMGSLSCHGYLIDELWLISSSECFVNSTSTKQTTSDDTDDGGRPTAADITGGSLLSGNNGHWTAEISYEHYGEPADLDHDVRSPVRHSSLSIRRNINEILMQVSDDEEHHSDSSSSTVLLKLDEPVRFSPLNRPICLPAPVTGNRTNPEPLPYRDCFTIGLPSASSSAAISSPNNGSFELNNLAPTHGLALNRVKVHEMRNCFSQQAAKLASSRERRDESDGTDNQEQSTARDSSKLKGHSDLVCVSDYDGRLDTRRAGHDNLDDDQPTGRSGADRMKSSARALICSTIQTSSRSRPKWTVVGVQHKIVPELEKQLLSPDRQLFAKVSSQIDWIVDTMNPKSSHLNLEDQISNNNNNNHLVEAKLKPNKNDSSEEDQTTCNKFKCSSGECLSWSRICDGLYDCSSQDDEKDCHK